MRSIVSQLESRFRAIAITFCLVAGSLSTYGRVSGCAAEAQSNQAKGKLLQATNGPVRQIGPGLFEIGKLRLDQAKGTISFPATVNLREGPIEYLLVAEYGKIHESLLRTEVDPYSIQLALLLLGAQPGETNAVGGAHQTSRSNPTKLRVEIVWKVKNRLRRQRAGNFVWDRRAKGKLGNGRWFFAGSRLRDDGFAAQSDGSIITVIDDADAIIGSQAPNREDDDNWLAIAGALPAAEAPVEVIVILVR